MVKTVLMDPQLFARVPPEVWSIIFEYLKDDHRGLYSSYSARSEGAWRDLLLEERTRFLFPLIISNLRARLNTKELLLLRAVCKTWKSAVETLLDSSPPYLPIPSTPAFRNVHEPEVEWFEKSSPVIGTTFSLPSQIDNFSRQMANVTGSPFLNRTVKVLDNRAICRQARAKLYKNFTNLIKIHGHHIQTLIYFADGSIDCNREMGHLFKHLPNLRCLTIKKIYDWAQENDEIYAEIQESLNWVRNSERLPPMIHLRSLNLFLDSKLFCEHLLTRYGHHLESLQIELNAIEHCPYFNELPVRRQGLRNLRSLKVIGVYGDSSILNRLSRFDLPYLQRLYLNYSEVGRRVSGLRGVLKLINKVAPSLQEFRFPFNLFNLDDTYAVDYGPDYEEDVGVKISDVRWIGVPYSYLGYSVLDKMLDKFPGVAEIHLMDFDVYYRNKMVEREELHQQTDHLWEKVPGLEKLTVEEERSNKVVFQVTRELYEHRKKLTFSSLLRFQAGDEDDDEDYPSD